MVFITDTLKKEIAKASGAKSDQVNLDIPDNPEFGDYSTNIALMNSKSSKDSPQELAEKYIQKLSKSNSLKQIVSDTKTAGPGFINFYLKNEQLFSELEDIKKKGSEYGMSTENKGKKAVVEYSSPNIAKPFGIGHFRSTIIGDAVANLLEATGWTVYRDNHLGDWGTQFGKQIYAIKTWGDEQKLDKSDNPVEDLVDLYVKFHEEAEKDPGLEDRAREWFKKLEDGDTEARRLWQKCIDWSFKEFDRIYEILGIEFTENGGKGFGESYFEDKMDTIVQELDAKGILRVGKEGAKLVFFPNEKYPAMMIIKKDGSTLYATRDLATDKFRLQKYGQDVVIVNEVGAEQSLYFNQLYEIEKILGWVKSGQRVHIKHGLFNFKGKKMSTRKGNIIWLADVIDQAIKRAEELGSEDKKLAKTVGVGALKYNELKRDPIKNIDFDWDEILSMDGNSGPYIQYTYARTQSVLSKAKGVKNEVKKAEKLDGIERQLARTLSQFPGIVASASESYSPNMICNYLYNLAQTFNRFYTQDKIIGSGKENLRLLLTSDTGQVIKNGLALLGIQAPERM